MDGAAIEGVWIKSLKSHGDERGYFRELIRHSDPFFGNSENFGQWSHSRMQLDVVKAWHYHHLQTDWWYIGLGTIRAALIDNREESPSYKRKMEFLMGDGPDALCCCVKIPPGVLHGCRVISPEAHLFYITSHVYDPADEGRIPFDSHEVDHDWGPGAIVVDNDKRAFVPKAVRAKLN